jgi:hypothetical protein
LDQYGRAQAFQDCLVKAGLPAELTPADGGEASLGWAVGHEVMARDFENVTFIVEGPAGEIDPARHEAFLNAGQSAVSAQAELWVDGVDQTEVWIRCLESSAYTNPTAYLQEDPGELLKFSQGRADAANDWIACARGQGLQGLVDVTADASGMAPGPHAEVPLETDPVLLRSVVEACPTFNEEYNRRLLEGDPTLEDDVEAGRIKADPTVFVEQPEGYQDDDYDYDSAEYKHYDELLMILNRGWLEFEEHYSDPEKGG